MTTIDGRGDHHDRIGLYSERGRSLPAVSLMATDANSEIVLAIGEWAEGHQIDGRTLAETFTAIRIALPDGTTIEVSGRQTQPWERPGDHRDQSVEMWEDPWHELWHDAAEHMKVTGEWIHPETRMTTGDPYCLAQYGGTIYIGCADLEDPSAPRRFDPTKDPVFNDIGVIAFPVHADGFIPEMIESGFSSADAGRICGATAVLAAAAHETIEHQALVRPEMNPHRAKISMEITFDTATGPYIMGVPV